MKMRKEHIKTEDLVRMYIIQHLSTLQIQRLTGMSPPGIMKRLKKIGITAHQGEWVSVNCEFCGKEYPLERCKWRKSQDHYCKKECYYASRENPNYRPHRAGQRLARAIVSQHIKLLPGYVVHHKDGNNRNNNLDNLMVYASNGEHIKGHHGKSKSHAVWDGATR